MNNQKVIISCGASKLDLQPGQYVKAYELYTGGYYKKMLNLATRLGKDVYILSAGYGLLNANDLVTTYDIKMTPARAKRFKQQQLVTFSGISLLGKVYEASVIGDLVKVIPDGLGMGLRMQYAMKAATKLPVIANLQALPNGNVKTLLSF